MFFDELGRDVPTAVVAGGRLVIATVAIEGSTVEELLQPRSIFGFEVAGIAWQWQLVAATIAAPGVQSSQERGIMVVHAPRHHASPVAQRTGHAELSGNRFPNKRALIRQFIEEFGQLGFDFESHYSGLQGLAGHSWILQKLSAAIFPVSGIKSSTFSLGPWSIIRKQACNSLSERESINRMIQIHRFAFSER